jgi:hypothetical protein
MVKGLLAVLFLAASLWAQSPLFEKVRSLVGDETYAANEAFIKIIFSNRQHYVKGDRIDVVNVIDTLKENGLLKLFYDSPKSLELTFRTNGTPQFFMTLMNDTLRDMGYYHYITESAELSNVGYTWKITMQSEYATDPMALEHELERRGCRILDIERDSDTKWRYLIDMSNAHLKLTPLKPGANFRTKRLVYPRWLNVSDTRKLTVWSLQGNNWYPYIAFYDDDLRLLKLYKREKTSWQVIINLPRGCAYVKIADLYSRKNVNAGFRIQAQ